MTRVNPDMVIMAREASRLTQQELAARASVSQALISKIENGVHQPPPDAVSRLAAALGVTEAFLQMDARLQGLPVAFYRKRASVGAKTIRQLEAQFMIARLAVGRLALAVDTACRHLIPRMDADESSPEDVARAVRVLWSIPSGPIRTVVDVIEDAGIVVVEIEMVDPKVDAVSYHASDGIPPVIFLRAGLPGDRARFSLAHELGHLIMHFHPDLNDEREPEADRFAAEFLMPQAEIQHQFRRPTLGEIARLKPYWRCSIAALVRRAHDTGQVSKAAYQSLCIQLRQNGWHRVEPCAVEPETPRLLREILETHTSDLGYSAEEMASVIGAGGIECIRRAFAGEPPAPGRLRLL